MICLSAPREVRFDCGHACCCAACAEELLSEQGRPTNPNPNPNPIPNPNPNPNPSPNPNPGELLLRPAFEAVRVEHLFANTGNERTLLARRK